MSTQRDPKKHQKRGDTLRRFGCTRHVTAVAKKANGTLISVYFNGGNLEPETRVSIGAWRSWANADCEVLLCDDTSDDPITPRMYIATHRCGGLVASSWDDDGYEYENQQHCRDWHAKGYQVSKISVPDGTPVMRWCECNRHEQKGADA